MSGDDSDDSSDYEDNKPIEIDKEFIDDNTFEEDVNFYRTIDSKKSHFDCTQVGKLKIDSESEEEWVEMDDLDKGSHIPELDDSDDDDRLPEVNKHIYGTDNYEWNNFKRPNDSDIYEFGEEKYFLFNFQESLRIRYTKDIKNNKVIFGFSYVAQFYLPPNSIETTGKKQQALDALYWSVLYVLRLSINDRCDHTFDFSCIVEDVTEEFKTI